MNNRLQSELLFDRLFSERDLHTLEQESLANTLACVRRRKERQTALRAAASALALAAGLVLVLRAIGWDSAQHPKNARTVETQPLNLPIAIHSEPTKRILVQTLPLGSAQIVRTDPATVPLHYLSDHELLALAGNKPVLLVKETSERAQLIFLNPHDARTLLVLPNP